MSSATFDSIKHEISLYIPCFLLLFGNIGCLLNFVTFTTKKLRENSCGWYFLMSAIIDFLIINFGLITYRNLHLSRKRLLRENTHQRNRLDINLLFIFCNNIR